MVCGPDIQEIIDHGIATQTIHQIALQMSWKILL